MNTKRVIIIVAIVVSIATIAYYRFYLKTSPVKMEEKSSGTVNELNIAVIKDVSAVATYAIPNGEDKVKFTLTLDKNGIIMSVKSTDVIKPDEVNSNLEKFNNGLEVVIKGKKLSELNNVDKVGTSSLTTDAFNKVLGELKAQI